MSEVDETQTQVSGSQSTAAVEIALISAAMVQPARVFDDADHVTPTMFSSPLSGFVWSVAQAVYERERGLDAALLLSACQGDPVYRDAGARVVECVTAGGMPSLAGSYARDIHDAYTRRQLGGVSLRIRQVVDDGDMPTDEIVENARAWIDQCDETITQAPMIGEDLEGWTEQWMNGVRLVPFPWESLNRAAGGLAPGALTVVAGAPSNGKSILALQAAEGVAGNGLAVSYSSTEMTQRELMNRLVAAASEVSITKIQRHEADDDEKARWRAASRRVATLPIAVNPRTTVSVRGIRSHARSLMRRGPLGAIVVDYLQQVDSTSHKHSEYEAMNEVSKQLKALALEMQVPVIVVSSVNRNRRQGQNPRDVPPTLDDLRGSGTIGHDADLVIFTEIDPEDPGTALLYIAKNRNGERNTWVNLRNRSYVMRFDDPSHRG